MFFLGIDPGKSGAFALLEGPELVAVYDFDEGAFLDLINFLMHEQMATRCAIEKVAGMHGQGVTSTFTFGQNFGWLLGVLDLSEISYQLVPPKTWKREFSLTSDKNLSVEACRRLFPKAELIPKKCRVPRDGRAEAILLAEYCRRKF